MKILVVKLSSLGDILHLFPTVSDLRKRFETAEIHWLVEPTFSEAVRWHAAVDKVMTVPLRSHKKTWWKIPALLSGLRKQLKAEHYSFVIDAQGLLKSALLSRLAGATVYGFGPHSAREPIASRLYEKYADVPTGLHVVEKNRQMVKLLLDTETRGPADFGLEQFCHEQRQVQLPDAVDLNAQPHIMLLHGTTWTSKHWPETSWQELIGEFSRQGWSCLIPWGNEIERQRAIRMRDAGGDRVTLLPKLTLTEMMRVLLHVRAFVSVESGIGHIAAALDIPGIMLHGPTSPGYSGISGKSCLHITSNIECSPCYKRDCPILNENGLPPCQLLITPQQIFRKCIEIMA